MARQRQKFQLCYNIHSQLSQLHQTFGLSNLRFLSELQTREMFLWLTHLEFLPGFYLCNWCNLSLVFASTMNRFWCVIDSIRLHRIHKYKLHSNNHSDFQLKSRFLVELTIQQDKKCCKQAQNSEQNCSEYKDRVIYYQVHKYQLGQAMVAQFAPINQCKQFAIYGGKGQRSGKVRGRSLLFYAVQQQYSI